MNGHDVKVDGFPPHGTRAGFLAGCKSAGGCPNHGSATLMTCVQANIRYGHDLQFRRAVDDGTATAELEQFADRVATAIRTTTPVEQPRRGPWTAFPPKPTPPAPAPEPAATPAAQPVTEEPPVPTARETLIAEAEAGKHGTEKGYKLGCRRGDDCPAAKLGGPSCQQVKADLNRKQRERRAEAQRSDPLEPSARTETEAVVEEDPTPTPAVEAPAAAPTLVYDAAPNGQTDVWNFMRNHVVPAAEARDAAGVSADPRDETIAELRAAIAERDKTLAAKTVVIETRDAELDEQFARVRKLEADAKTAAELLGADTYEQSRREQDLNDLLLAERLEHAATRLELKAALAEAGQVQRATLVVEPLPDGSFALQFDRPVRTQLTYSPA